MAKKNLNFSKRESTIIRNRQVGELYKSIISGLGELASFVSKSYIYDKIKDKTGLSVRTIQYILNGS